MMKKENGITLIALVITIVVLLILAGISINAIFGNNGIFNKANSAKINTEKAEIEENLNLALANIKAKKETGLENRELKSYFDTLEKFQSESNWNSKIYIIDDTDYNYLEEENCVNLLIYKNKGCGKKFKFKIDLNLSKVIYLGNEENGDAGNTSKENESEFEHTDLTGDINIKTEEDLISFRERVNSGEDFSNKLVVLKNDITLTEKWKQGDGEKYIGTNENNFNGIFNGQYYSIKNLDRALFGNNNGEINYLVLSDGIITNTSQILSNYNVASSIVLYNKNKVSYCVNKNQIEQTTTSSIIGGIVGINDGTIEYSYNLGKIFGKEFVAGISGYNAGTIQMTYNLGNVTEIGGGNYCDAGGIVARGTGNVIKCYNAGEIRNESTASNVRAGGIISSYEGLSGLTTPTGSTSVNYVYNIGKIYAVRGSFETAGGIIAHGSNGNTNYVYNIGQIVSAGRRGEITGYGSYGSNVYILKNTPEEMLTGLGEAFIEDSEFKNLGFPILKDLEYKSRMVNIENEEDLKNIIENLNSSVTSVVTINIARDIAVSSDIGTINKFFGKFEGNNHTISGLTTPLITNNYGIISNLIIKDSNIQIDVETDVGNSIASITAYNFGAVRKCENYANIYSNKQIIAGGIAGYNNITGKIENCYNYGDVSSKNDCGGIAGECHGSIINCGNEADITLLSDSVVYAAAGGILGRKSEGNVYKTYNKGYIKSLSTSNNVRAAGIVGTQINNSIVKCSYNIGTIYINTSAGFSTTAGIVGHSDSNGIIENCYNIGYVKNSARRGEIVGYSGAVNNVYTYNNTPDEILTISEFEPDKTNLNLGYPTLAGLKYASETINVSSELELKNAIEKMNMNSNKHIIINIVNDITISNGIDAINNFYGIIKGNNKNIIGLTAPLVNNNFGTIENLNISGGNIINSLQSEVGESIASVTANNVGKISNCTNNSTIVTETATYIGGIAGYNSVNAEITYCCNKAEVTGKSNTGGIVSISEGRINNCSNQAKITVTQGSANYSNSAGIVGILKGNINRCYNTGEILNDSTANNVRAAGIVGSLASTSSKITNSYNIGAIKTNNASDFATAAGIIGHAETSGVIQNSYNIGEIQQVRRYSEIIAYGNIKIENTFTSTNTPEEMIEGLGENFEIIEGKNNGYPILKNY